MPTYPLAFNSLNLRGPTLIYLDEEGTPIQLRLNYNQVQAIIRDWNSTVDETLEEGVAPTVLKPPLTLPCVSTIYSPDGAGVTRDHHVQRGDLCIHCGTFMYSGKAMSA